MNDTDAKAFSARLQAMLATASAEDLIRGLYDLAVMRTEFKDVELYAQIQKLMIQRLYLKSLLS